MPPDDEHTAFDHVSDRVLPMPFKARPGHALRSIADMAEEVNWHDPEPLFEPAEAERSYPLDALLPVVAEAIREYQVYGQQPFSVIAGSALANASLASQGLVDVARDELLIGPISLNFLSIAISGERKTSADRAFSKAVREWMVRRQEAFRPAADRANADLAAWAAEREGLLQKIKRDAAKIGANAEKDIAIVKQRLAEIESSRPQQVILPLLFHEDTNSARLAVDIAEGWPSTSLWSDEAGLVIGSHGMSHDNLIGFLGLLNRLWDGLPFERRRLTMPSAVIKGRRLTVSLMMQPIIFAQLLSASGGASRGMGFIARSLPAWPASTIGSRSYREPSAMPKLDTFHTRISELLEMALPVEGAGMVLRPPPLGLSPGAFQVWRALHDEVEAELSRSGEFGSVPDIGAKIAENAARIAGVFHVASQGPGGGINAATMEGAAAVAVWHLNEARRVIGANDKPQDAADAELLLVWLLRQASESIEPREILNRGPNPLRKKERRDNALKVMIEKGWVAEIKIDGATRLTVNPKVRGAR